MQYNIENIELYRRIRVNSQKINFMWEDKLARVKKARIQRLQTKREYFKLLQKDGHQITPSTTKPSERSKKAKFNPLEKISREKQQRLKEQMELNEKLKKDRELKEIQKKQYQIKRAEKSKLLKKRTKKGQPV